MRVVMGRLLPTAPGGHRPPSLPRRHVPILPARARVLAPDIGVPTEAAYGPGPSKARAPSRHGNIADAAAARPPELLLAGLPLAPEVAGVVGLPGAAAVSEPRTMSRGQAATPVAGIVLVARKGEPETVEQELAEGAVEPGSAAPFRVAVPATR